MCTLIVAHRLFDSFPIVVAANRDELLSRPSELPCARDSGIFAPKDLKRGGSWIGVNEHGVFVALTNLSEVESLYGRISRGELVMDVLHEKTANLAFKKTELLKGTQFNGFHLVIADKNDMYLLRGNGVIIERFIRSNRLLVATNLGLADSVDGRASGRCKNILDMWNKNSIVNYEPTPQVLTQLLNIHDSCVSSGTCIHQPDINYGTKSSSIIRLKDGDEQGWEYWHRERTSMEQHICEEVFGEKMIFRINQYQAAR
ncbi:MAG: NRDE family protein [Candidatus Yanofskybacteria bacterium]|nr:NRDE family protein [Candidatus Yanofskybacteria bacterium]